MIHKFVANDNKGNVNVLEVTSTGTKLGKVAAPVEDTDVANKKYVDDNTGKRVVTLYAAVNSSNEIILDDDNGYTFSELKAYAESGYSFICHLTSTGIGFDLTCPVYPIEIRTYGIDFAGEAVLINTVPFTRAYVRFEVYEDDDDAYSISGTFGGNKYIVTLTPTAPDYSGTMDKTVAEINAAYEAGQEIVFSLSDGGNAYEMFASGRRLVSSENVYYVGVSFLGQYFVKIETSNDVTSNIYTTGIYSLTPAS